MNSLSVMASSSLANARFNSKLRGILLPPPKTLFVLLNKHLPITKAANNNSIELVSRSGRSQSTVGRRGLTLSLAAAGILTHASTILVLPSGVLAVEDDEYVKDTTEVISKVRNTINIDRKDPNIASAVAELREASNTWVAKYRREKALLGRASFRDVYSALNAVSGHYISFGPTAPIPAKRKARILEEVDTAEKALLRGR
ncbi:hypothetical protein HPP92_017063 [Vanilla planifolia]|uniref:Uncharacterized protein n=1 Tax=Vanilla planifolia TaxID=51239 RepID=A0A835QPF0_VANPL|nr:hypothetical protein HPP92_017063 [Vanilla planifolia]